MILKYFSSLSWWWFKEMLKVEKVCISSKTTKDAPVFHSFLKGCECMKASLCPALPYSKTWNFLYESNVTNLSICYLLCRSICALEQPRFREDEKLEGVLDATQVADVDDGQAVQLVQAGVLKPTKQREELKLLHHLRIQFHTWKHTNPNQDTSSFIFVPFFKQFLFLAVIFKTMKIAGEKKFNRNFRLNRYFSILEKSWRHLVTLPCKKWAHCLLCIKVKF